MRFIDGDNGDYILNRLNHSINGAGIRGFFPSDNWHYSLLNIKKDVPRKVVFMGDSVLDDAVNNMRTILTDNYYCNGLGFIKLDGDGTYNSDQLTMVIANSTFVEDAW